MACLCLYVLCINIVKYSSTCICSCVRVCVCVCVDSSRSTDMKRKSQMVSEDSFIHITIWIVRKFV